MQEGVSRDGDHLYPAFPYDHFTLISDTDDKALYAFLMSQDAVKMPTPPNHLLFPLDIRFTITGWKLLFFRPGRYQADGSKGEQCRQPVSRVFVEWGIATVAANEQIIELLPKSE